jgi:hypothetical protein
MADGELSKCWGLMTRNGVCIDIGVRLNIGLQLRFEPAALRQGPRP